MNIFVRIERHIEDHVLTYMTLVTLLGNLVISTILSVGSYLRQSVIPVDPAVSVWMAFTVLLVVAVLELLTMVSLMRLRTSLRRDHDLDLSHQYV